MLAILAPAGPAATSISHAAALTVTTLVDENGLCADGEGCSLREAIQEANPGDEIEFAVSGTITLASGAPLNIDKDLTITGPPNMSVILDGAGLYQIMDMNNDPTATISRLVFQNGFTSSNGGCLWVDGNTALNDCVFRDSHAGSNGGAVFARADHLSINSCLFQGNDVDLGSGGALGLNGGSVFINASAFRNNSAMQGGGLAATSSGKVRVNCCEFYGNTAGYVGGALYYEYSDSDIINTTISGNTATNYGGGVFVSADGDSLVSIIFSTIADNSAGDRGGGLYGSDKTRLKNTIISDNHDTDTTTSPARPDISSDAPLQYEGTVLVSDMFGVDLELIEGSTGTLIEDQSALLEPLAGNGGSTMTHALLPGSPALGAASDMETIQGDLIDQDQRYESRPQGDPKADIGAFESDLIGGTATAYTGWWWEGPDYSGTGISIEDQEGRIYLAWYGYDNTGLPVWYSALIQENGAAFAGDLARYTGWPLENDNPAAGYQGQVIGTLDIAFADEGHAVLNYSIDGTDYTKDLVRFWDGAQDIRPYHGWWYDPAYDGMGVFMEIRGGQLFGSWYHYRDDESPRWWITLGDFADNYTRYDGPLGEYSSGQTLTGPYEPAVLESDSRGPMSIDFLGNGQATMQWQGNTYNLERFDFAE